jgi:hypothetical protein
MKGMEKDYGRNEGMNKDRKVISNKKKSVRKDIGGK